ncbi:MAG: NADH-quinone oxidoreductase subunit H [Verrucomicrobiales bacterium]|nr:NADH-quinone oxidoreductase subunit H [Verrucomicrobiales bacterium]
MNPAPFLLIAVVALLLAFALGGQSARGWLAGLLTGGGGLATAALGVLLDGSPWDWHARFALGGETVHLRLDAVSAMFLLLIAVIGAAGGVYSLTYWGNDEHPRSAGTGRRWWSALVLCMALVVNCTNGLHFLIAWELFALAAYPLVTLDRKNREARAAGWLYLAASHAGTLVLFVFFGALAAKTGSWELGDLRSRPEVAPLFWLAMFGFGVKAGLFPLYIWLPSAHANAPSHVSAIMSGVAIKMGIYGIVRFGGWLPVNTTQALSLIGLATLGTVLGIAFAHAQNDLKRLLAYCSVENVGIILIGVGAALLGQANGHPDWGRLALAGALLHVWNHGLFKSLLFLGSGSVLHATGTREMTQLGGLWRKMPWTASLFAFGSAAISALPPLNGFVSEWLIYQGLFRLGLSHAAGTWAALVAGIGLAVAGALALACFVKLCGVVFLGAPRTPVAAHAHECGTGMRRPMLVLAGVCLAVGLLPVLVRTPLEHAVAAWCLAGDATAFALPLAPLARAHLALGAALVVGAILLFRRIRGGVVRRLTWDCGYAAPAARMQYTSGALAGWTISWFRWALWPVKKWHRLDTTLPRDAAWEERTPETVLERIVQPVARALCWLGVQTRRTQHGRLQLYILYLVLGLLALTFMALGGGMK